MKQKIKTRFEWVKLYQETNNAGLVCRRCGIYNGNIRCLKDRLEGIEKRSEQEIPKQSSTGSGSLMITMTIGPGSS